ncbi:MAG: hypothetical protein WAU32_00820 [Thermoanaerobaculia bacterium]
MRNAKLTIAAIALTAVAAIAFGQNADKNSAGPTKNDYRLRVVEPIEGVVLASNTLRVVVDTTPPAERDSPKKDVNSMPNPTVDLFLDGKAIGTLKDDVNVFELAGVPAGPHTLALVAKNRSGEVIDRKEIHFSVAVPPQ